MTASAYASGVVKSGNARAKASLNVVLQTRTRVVAREIDLARRNQEVPVDEIDDAIGEIRGEIRAVIGRAVVPQRRVT